MKKEMIARALLAVSLVLLPLLISPVTSADETTANITLRIDVWAQPTRVEPYEPSTVYAKVTEDGSPLENVSVFFKTDLGYLIDNRSTTYTTLTNESGLASVRFFAEASVTATITAAEKTGASNTTVVVVKATSSSGSGNGGGSNGGTTSTSTPTPMATPGENVTPSLTPTASPLATPTFTPMPSPAAAPLTTPTPTPAPSPSPTSGSLLPGFEAVIAISELLAVAYLAFRRARK